MNGMGKSLVIAVIALIVVGLVVSTSLFLMVYSNNNDGSSLIRINSDAEMASSASRLGWPGNGSSDNPFIIDGLSIMAEVSTPCVYIGNTSYHFLLSHCVMNTTEMAMTSGHGIELFNLSNGTIRNNTLINSNIFLQRCNSTRLDNNDIFALTLPIHISHCFGSQVLNNKISSRDQTALFEAVEDMRFENNTLSNPFYVSMELRSCSNNSLINNNLKGSLNLFACDNNLIRKNYLQSVSSPVISSTVIKISGGQSNQVQGNHIGGMGNGVELIGAQANLIIGNEVSAENYGILLTNATNNTCISNMLWGCHGSGDQRNPNHVQASDDTGSNRWNDSFGGNYWSDWAGALAVQSYELDGGAGAADQRPLFAPPVS